MKNYITAVMFFIVSVAFAFDWPQEEIVKSDSFYSYFGQLRGGTVSSSLIFSGSSQIKAADSGHIAVIIREFNDETDFFPSTLGNAVILAHEDALMTVYANIAEETIPEFLLHSNELEKGVPLGSGGNSAWQQGRSSLEFQVIDTSNNTAINPRLLMPRIGNELELTTSGIQLKNRAMKNVETGKGRIVPSDVYRVYQKRQPVASPYKTRLSLNGATVDEISYNMLHQSENKLCALGKKYYPKETLYPDDDLILLGEAPLTPGKNALSVTLSDILGKETEYSFSVNVQ